MDNMNVNDGNINNANGGKVDDGSLAFLNIPRDENSRSFNCKDVSQSKLVNTTFWLVDFLEDIPTRFSKQKGTSGQTLVLVKRNLEDPESEAMKFFTGSKDILYILQEIKKRDAFPRKATMRSQGNRYFLE